MRLSRTSVIIATMTLPFLVACGSAQDAGGQSLGELTATIEKAGFTCEEQERHPKSVSQVSQCRSNQNKYRILTVSQWNDPKARDEMYENKLPSLCDRLGMKGQIRWSTSGSWLLVAGASKEEDVKALDEASKALGFEPHAVPCQ